MNKQEAFFIAQDFLALEAKLRDKSVLDVWITDVIRVRKIRKRGSSGKIKHATKAKANQRVRIRLVVPEGRVVRAPAAGSRMYMNTSTRR